jgi:hypothetical protein
MIRSFLALFAIALAGYAVGPRLVRGRSPLLDAVWGGIGVLLAFIIIRCLWFYAGGHLNRSGDVWTLLITLAAVGAWLMLVRRKREIAPRQESHDNVRGYVVTAIGIVLATASMFVVAWAAFRAGTSDSIRTPWPLLPGWTLSVIGMLWAFSLALAWKARRTASAVALACAYASLFLIAPLLYVIGYGFDSFLHIAGERVLEETGTLMPKPLYYMGQYVLVVWLSRIFDLPVADIDRFLVPAAAAVLIPLAALLAFPKRSPASSFAALVLIPVSAFVATTPHGLATIFAVSALLLSIRRGESGVGPLLPILSAIASAVTHPLVGLPVTGAVLMDIVFRSGMRASIRTAGAWLLAFASGLVVPAVFGLSSAIGSNAGVTFDARIFFDPAAWSSLISTWVPWVPNRYAIWPESAAWIMKLLPMLTTGLAISAAVRDRFAARDDRRPNALWLTAAASAFLASVVLRLAGDFDFLIDYERGNYAERLAQVAWLLLIPLAVPELGSWLEKAKRASMPSAIAILASIGLFGAGAAYAALPRHDAATASRGWSVGKADIEAVRLIDEDASGRPYTVLANQSVSAAAVREFGFKRYHDDVFFYPIPTGGELYDVFLTASYEDPGFDAMRAAGALGGSDLVYFVVNEYWWKADELAERAKRTANREFVIQDEKVRVYRYDLADPVRIDDSSSP